MITIGTALDDLIAIPKSGIIIVHPSSFPSLNEKYRDAIGTFGSAAHELVDRLAESKTGFWQTLPLGYPAVGNSPFATFSKLAIFPGFIDLELLEAEGLLLHNDIGEYQMKLGNFDRGKTWYDTIRTHKIGESLDSDAILRKACRNEMKEEKCTFTQFCRIHANWLDEYADMMGVRDFQEGKPWPSFPTDFKFQETWKRNKDNHLKEIEGLKEAIEFHKWTQYKA